MEIRLFNLIKSNPEIHIVQEKRNSNVNKISGRKVKKKDCFWSYLNKLNGKKG